MTKVDVLIVGGGVMGSACAMFLLKAAPGLSVTVVEVLGAFLMKLVVPPSVVQGTPDGLKRMLLWSSQ